MAEDSVLNLIASEFKLWGVKFQHRLTNGGHIELAWQVSPDKKVRKTFIPHTGSDWRGWLNQRAHVRRLFQQDGLSLKTPPKPEPAIVKALSLPVAPEKPEDQFRAMRAEIADLTNFVIELGGIVSTLSEGLAKQNAYPMPVPEPTLEVAPSPAIVVPVRSVRSIKTIDHVSENWNSTSALAKSMGLSEMLAYRKLYYLMRQNKIEHYNGTWRLIPPKPAKVMKPKPNGKKVPPAIIAKRKRSNGYALNGRH